MQEPSLTDIKTLLNEALSKLGEVEHHQYIEVDKLVKRIEYLEEMMNSQKIMLEDTITKLREEGKIE